MSSRQTKVKVYVAFSVCLVGLCAFILISSISRKEPGILKEHGLNNIRDRTYYNDGAIGYITLLSSKQKSYDYMLELKVFPNGHNECYIHVAGKNHKSGPLDYGEPEIKMFVPIDEVGSILKDGLPEWANDVIVKELQQNNWRSGCRFTTGKTITLSFGINPEESSKKEDKRRKIGKDDK